MNYTKKFLITLFLVMLPEIASAETSAEARANKTFFFQGHLGLVAEPSIAGSAGLFLTSSLTLEVHASASTSLDGTAQSNLASVRTRYFWGNSIYTVVGFGGRSYRKIVSGEDYDYRPINKSEEFISDLGFEAAVGNLWTLNKFNIGLDWLWFYAPTMTTHRERREYDQFGELTRKNTDKRGYYAPPIVVAPRLNIGFSF